MMKSHFTEKPSGTGLTAGGTDCPIDVASALERTMGDIDFLEMMLQQFLDQMPVVLDELNKALRNGDEEDVVRKAHSLRGSAANLSATQIAAMALQLEEMGRTGELKQGADALDLLRAEMNRLGTYISKPHWSKTALHK
jgi:HPt (histidine-containing phosphotransfer) domain-containing protein